VRGQESWGPIFLWDLVGHFDLKEFDGGVGAMS